MHFHHTVSLDAKLQAFLVSALQQRQQHDFYLEASFNRMLTHMSDRLDAAIAALTMTVSNQTTVINSASALITGFSAQLAAGIAAAKGEGVTDDELSELTGLQTTLDANSQALSSALAANTAGTAEPSAPVVEPPPTDTPPVAADPTPPADPPALETDPSTGQPI